MRRAHVLLDEEDLWRALALEPGERVVGFWPAPLTNGIVVGIEGGELEDVAPGHESPRVRRPYAIDVLRKRLEGLYVELRPHVGNEEAMAEFYKSFTKAVLRDIFPEIVQE